MRAQEVTASFASDAALRALAEAQLAPVITAARAEADMMRTNGASWWQRYKQRARVARLAGTAAWLRNPSAQRNLVIARSGILWGIGMFFGLLLLGGSFDLHAAGSVSLVVVPGVLVIGLFSWAVTEPTYVACLRELEPTNSLGR